MAATPRPLADIARGIAAALPRRRFLAGFATLAAATGAAFLDGPPAASATAAIATPPADADRRLAALLEAWNAGQRAFEQAFADEVDACDRIPDLAPPAALLCQPDDRWIFMPHRVERFALWHVQEIRRRLREEDPRDAGCDGAAASRRRLMEIVAAWDGWEAAKDREAERCGYSAAARRRMAAGQRVAELRAAIADVPAATPFGLLTKLGVASDGFDDAEIAKSLARQRCGAGASAGAVLVSAMRDFRAVFPAAATPA